MTPVSVEAAQPKTHVTELFIVKHETKRQVQCERLAMRWGFHVLVNQLLSRLLEVKLCDDSNSDSDRSTSSAVSALAMRRSLVLTPSVSAPRTLLIQRCHATSRWWSSTYTWIPGRHQQQHSHIISHLDDPALPCHLTVMVVNVHLNTWTGQWWVIVNFVTN